MLGNLAAGESAFQCPETACEKIFSRAENEV